MIKIKKKINFYFFLVSIIILLYIINGFLKSAEKSLKIVDFSENLCSNDLYNNIYCRKSLEIIVSTTLCIHDITRDAHVSRAIWQDGVWEGPIVKLFIDYLNKNSDWLVFDVGAQVGQFSLFAAKLGRDVIAVEPFYDNILRFHKAVRLERLNDKIKLVHNAISNKREIKRLFSFLDSNLGAQTLLKFRNESYTKYDMKNDRYLVETVLFDDLISIIPKKKDGSNYKEGILKIDIEGFEPYALDQAKKLFSLIDIKVIFMEWVHLPRHPEMFDLIEQMIQFLVNHGMQAFINNQKLDIKTWKNWPQDVIWIKN